MKNILNAIYFLSCFPDQEDQERFPRSIRQQTGPYPHDQAGFGSTANTQNEGFEKGRASVGR